LGKAVLFAPPIFQKAVLFALQKAVLFASMYIRTAHLFSGLHKFSEKAQINTRLVFKIKK